MTVTGQDGSSTILSTDGKHHTLMSKMSLRPMKVDMLTQYTNIRSIDCLPSLLKILIIDPNLRLYAIQDNIIEIMINAIITN